MEHRQFGRSGLRVTALSLGAMTFGEAQGFMKGVHADDAEARRVLDTALDAGIDTIDTANGYAEGRSEEFLGRALKARRRDSIVLATKCRFPTLGGTAPMHPNQFGLSRASVLWNCEQSLKRLQTDYIDLYQVHMQDGSVPIDETLRAMDDLVRSGKVRYIGCSNYTGWQLMKALAIADARNLERFVTLQAFYSLIARDLELELVPLSLEEKLGILPWSPLGGGFLTGKYRRGKPRPQGARRTDTTGQFLQFDEERGFTIVDELEKVAVAHGATITQAALNYLLRKPGVTSVIIGAKTMAQLADDLKAADWEMTAEEVARLDALSAPPRLYPHWMLERLTQDR